MEPEDVPPGLAMSLDLDVVRGLLEEQSNTLMASSNQMLDVMMRELQGKWMSQLVELRERAAAQNDLVCELTKRCRSLEQNLRNMEDERSVVLMHPQDGGVAELEPRGRLCDHARAEAQGHDDEDDSTASLEDTGNSWGRDWGRKRWYRRSWNRHGWKPGWGRNWYASHNGFGNWSTRYKHRQVHHSEERWWHQWRSREHPSSMVHVWIQGLEPWCRHWRSSVKDVCVYQDGPSEQAATLHITV
ncbi:unnamed protein product [Symbiodinium sp. CCMP2592]|nr:unnamed protein product [Symbiodinium sp. CCMP2592]